MTAIEQSNICNPLSGKSSRQRIALLLEYHGAIFHGSQFQPNLLTVHGELMNALKKLAVVPYSMMFAGRTDAGVHAKGQVVHFDIDVDALKSIVDLRLALNMHLPPEMSIRAVHLNADPSFHSQRHARYKWYRYKMYLGPHRSIWTPPDAAFLKNPGKTLDLDRMNQAAQMILGKHSFKSFQCTGTDLQSDVCAIMKAHFHLETGIEGDFSGNLLIFDIVGDRFLYKMVRSLVGQLIEIGQANPTRFPQAQDPSYIQQVLAHQDRKQAAFAAPANGLSLMSVVYPELVDYFKDDPLRVRLASLLSDESLSGPALKDPVHSDSQTEASTNQGDEHRIFNETQMERKQNEDLFCKAS